MDSLSACAVCLSLLGTGLRDGEAMSTSKGRLNLKQCSDAYLLCVLAYSQVVFFVMQLNATFPFSLLRI